MEKKLKVTVKLSNGEEITENVNFKYGNEYAKYGIIDPNNPDGDKETKDEDIRLDYLTQNTKGNFFRIGSNWVNTRYVGLIKVEVLDD